MVPVLLVHHAARCGHRHPPNSLAALSACLSSGARAVEVDVQALADGDYALLHDALLEKSTTGHGPVDRQTSSEVRGLRLVAAGRETGEPVALLSQVVGLLAERPGVDELQLDLKVHPGAPPTDDRLRSLAGLIQPIRERVRVSSTADWALRHLHALAPGLSLGFDPLLYLDVREPDDAPPYRRGAYGYRDDHPLAALRWGEAREYLSERAESLWAQAPMAGVWYIRAATLARALDDGFSWIGFLQARGALAGAWTLDADRPADVALARRLAEAGVDRITTNDAAGLAEALGRQVTY